MREIPFTLWSSFDRFARGFALLMYSPGWEESYHFVVSGLRCGGAAVGVGRNHDNTASSEDTGAKDWLPCMAADTEVTFAHVSAS